MRRKKLFLKHIHHFRAFAIMNIVCSHTWHIPSRYKGFHGATITLVDTLKEVLFHDSTIYFIYISGFLFYYLSPKFELTKYYKSKLFNVISPYIFMTLLILILKYVESILFQETTFYSMKEIIWTLIHGTAQIQYWYIPFVALIFFVSPLLLKIPIIRSKKIFILVSILPLFGTRTGTDISVWQYVYFFPIYLQGIHIAMNYSNFISTIKKWKIVIILVIIISSILLMYLHINPYRYKMINISESLYYIQKLSIGLFVLLLLQKSEDKDCGLLNKLATYSFAIYFTHTLIANLIPTYQYYLFFSNSALLIFLASIAHVIMIIFSTLFACFVIKKILGKKSRYFIGV